MTARAGDSLYTLTLANNIATGLGYGLDCVMHFHKQYSGGTWVQDCFRAPFGPLFFAGVQYLFGKSLFIAHAASAAISTFFIPFLTLHLAGVLFAPGRAAKLAAYCMALHPLFLEISLSASYDILAAALGLTALLLVFKGFERPWLLPLAGLLWGLAYLTKETYLILVPIGIVLRLLAIRYGAPRPSRRFVIGLVGAVVFFAAVIQPWRMHCESIPEQAKLTKADVPAACGFYNKDAFYCDKVPQWMSQSEEKGIIARFSRNGVMEVAWTFGRNALSAMHHLFLNIFIPGESELKQTPEMSCPFYGIPFPILLQCEAMLHGQSFFTEADDVQGDIRDVFLLALKNITFRGVLDTLFAKSLPVTIIGLLALAGAWQYRRSPGVVIALGTTLAFTAAISAFTFTHIRYILPCYPLIAIVAAQYTASRWKRIPSPLIAVFLGSLLLGAYFIHQDWHTPPAKSYDSVHLQRKTQRVAIAERLAQELPADSVLLASGAIYYHYHSGLPAVELPYPPPGATSLRTMLEVIRQYGVTHIVLPEDDFKEQSVTASLDEHLCEKKAECPFVLLRKVDGARIVAVNAAAVEQLLSTTY